MTTLPISGTGSKPKGMQWTGWTQGEPPAQNMATGEMSRHWGARQQTLMNEPREASPLESVKARYPYGQRKDNIHKS